MRVLSCFSGIGLHDLGLEWAGMEIVGQIENDEYCTSILEKHWPAVPKWGDIRGVTANDIRRRCGQPDLITGGFPCTQISNAGTHRGIIGEDSGLWREMWRLIRSLRPRWVLIENVSAFRVRGADGVISAMEALGYSCWPMVVQARHAGSPQGRERVFVVGYSEGKPRSQAAVSKRSRKTIAGTQHPSIHRFPAPPGVEQYDWEEPRSVESEMGSSTNGRARRLALKALGNANPPQVLEVVGRAIFNINSLLQAT